MLKNILIPFLIILGYANLNAQQSIQVNYISPQQAVENVLLGNGVIAFNITYNGYSMSLGRFTDPTGTFPFGSGLVLSTSNSEALGSTNADGTFGNTVSSDTVNTINTDADLDQLTNGEQTQHTNILEFDFIPASDSLSFFYIFGSEEYTQYVNTQYNDVFGFFLSGPGINGPYSNNSINLATIPEAGTPPVTISNLNCNTNSAYYVCNGDGNTSGTSPCPTSFPCTNGGVIEFNGHSVPMLAQAHVSCGDTFHIKIAIANVSDFGLDSGVLLQAESFASGGLAVTTQTLSGDSIISEGCMGAGFLFTRIDTASTDTVTMVIGGNAIAGTDYQPIPNTVIFPQGEDSVIVPVTVFQDGIFEGTDTLTVTVSFVTECGNTIVRQGILYIVDTVLISTAPDTFIVQCNTDSFFVTVTPQNGNPPFIYDWSTGDITDTIWLHSVQDTFVTVQITDTCGNTSGIDTVYIHFQLLPPLTSDLVTGLANDSLSCDNYLYPYTNVTGGLVGFNGYNFLWSNGDISQYPYYFIDSSQYVWVEVSDLCGVTIRDSVFIVYTVPPAPIITLTIPDTTISCPNLNGLTIGANVVYSGNPFDYNWSNGEYGWWVSSITPISINPTNTTEYYVSTYECGRYTYSDTTTVTVIIPPAPSLTISGNQTVQCLGDTVHLLADVQGGDAPYYYNWNGPTGSIPIPSSNSTVVVTVNSNTQIQLFLTDACHTTPVQATVIVEYIAPPPISISLSDSSVHCAGDAITLNASITGGAQPLQYIDWSNEPGLNNDTSIYSTINSDTTFYISVKDHCDTVRTDSVKVIVQQFPPISVSVNSDSTYCASDSVIFNGSATGGDGNLVTEWWADGVMITNALTFADTFGSPDTTFYILKATDGCGNVSTDTFKLGIKACEINVSNFISPNGDGFNDFLIFPNAQYYPENTLQVYDRWGHRVFQSTNYKNDWNGGKLNDGTYFWILTPTTTPQGPFKGFLQLIRDK